METATKTHHEPVTAYSTAGKWHMGPGAPNGSVPGQMQRYLETVEVYRADYYGKGSKLYADGKQFFQTKSGDWTCINLWSDGNEDRISERLAKAGVSLVD